MSSVLTRLKSSLPPRLKARLGRMRESVRQVVGRPLQPVLARMVLLNLRLSRKRQIAKYLAGSKVRKLQLGSGSNILPGWLNTEGFVPSSFTHSLDVAKDNVLLDVCEPFPLAKASVDYVFTEHVIEHLTYQQGGQMLAEAFRVLKPGGRIRVATPDLGYFLRLYTENPSAEQENFINEYVQFNSSVWSSDLRHVTGNKAIFMLNHAVRAWGHQFLYDYSTLADLVSKVGFVNVIRREPFKSDDVNLRGLEFRKELVGILDALIVEGTKPAGDPASISTES